MIYHHCQAQNGPNTYSDPEAIKAAIDDMDDDQVTEFAQGNLRMSAPTEVQAQRKWLAVIRVMMLKTASAGTQGRCFVPPEILRTRHKAFDPLWDGISRSASQSLKKQAIEHIESTWKPNPSLFKRYSMTQSTLLIIHLSNSSRLTLLNKKDFARFFGCRVVSSNACKVVEFAAKPLHCPLSTLATREELIEWLTRVLITNILPPESLTRPKR
ncbi:hypothetical protein ARMGADRAFT_1110668 [Armillaria gallica]|uniref:Uncharacterized protein n=1 Tax=Armillaria gallica TaxID=47427 RepID=A0A2H3E6F3_ARMGA|nr:hypothetical protein ARMGADRAFT_1110668 [Armillaria gallica]